MKQLFTLLVVIAFSQISLGQIQIGQDIDGEAADDYSGWSVSLSADGSRVAIGATQNDGNGTDAGHVRIYEYSGGSWIQLGSDIDGETADDYSGFSVSLSADGNTVAIGAYGNDGNGSFSGHVRIYEYYGGSWTQLGADIDGEAADDQSGVSVSLSADGSTVAIGAYLNDGNGTDAGHVRIYEYSGGSWMQLGADIDGEAAADRSGLSVSLSADGSRVAIGAPNNDGNGTFSGHMRIYEYSSGSWIQLGNDIDGEAAYDGSGRSVSLSADGSTVAIGAYANDGNGSNSGHVRIYEYSGGSWIQLGSDIDGEAAGDWSGFSVSLSADGSRVAIGAYRNDGNGSDAGHVRIYEYSGGSWTQLGADIDGEAAGDWSGYCVSLSENGDTVAIGGFNGGNGNGSYSGHVRIYSTCGSIYTNQVVACNSYTWIDGVTYSANTTSPQVTLTAANGCDSIVSLDLTIDTSVSSTDQVVACNSYTWIDGVTYSASTTSPQVTLTAANGCDSIVSLDLTIDSSVSSTDQVVACNSYTWIDGVTYSASTTSPQVTLTAANGCDSIVTLDLTINAATAGQLSLMGCDKVSLNGQSYTVSGNYIQNLTNSQGCDSVLTINVSVTYSNFIQTQPTDTSVGEGQNALFFLLGPPSAQYQWQTNLGLGYQDLSDFGQYSGTTTPNLQVSGVNITTNNNQAFRCLVTEGNCTDTSYVAVLEVLPNTSVNELEKIIELYPNPTSGNIKVILPEAQGVIRVYDVRGKMLEKILVNQKEMQVSLGSYANGVYLIQIEQNGMKTARRVTLSK